MPRRAVETACQSGKVQYRDRIAALLAVASMPGGRDECRGYRCPLCASWHLTSKRAYQTPLLAGQGDHDRKPYERPNLHGEGPP